MDILENAASRQLADRKIHGCIFPIARRSFVCKLSTSGILKDLAKAVVNKL
jgi:hypothetical protein